MKKTAVPDIYFISESTANNVEFKIIKEACNHVIATGIIQRGNEVNRNRRKYPSEALLSEINSDRTKELISTGNMKGEAGHPITTDMRRQATIDPKLEQVLYTKLWMEGDEVHANFMGTNNDLGESFDKDLRMGQLPSFSMRGLGSMVAKDGYSLIPKLKLITYDRVYYPSHKGAYTSKILSEAFGYEDDSLNESSIIIPEAVTKAGNEYIVSEGYDMTFKVKTNNSVSDFVLEESPSMKTVYEMLFLDTKNNKGVLSESGNHFVVKDDNTTYFIPVESYIRNEILNTFRK